MKARMGRQESLICSQNLRQFAEVLLLNPEHQVDARLLKVFQLSESIERSV